MIKKQCLSYFDIGGSSHHDQNTILFLNFDGAPSFRTLFKYLKKKFLVSIFTIIKFLLNTGCLIEINLKQYESQDIKITTYARKLQITAKKVFFKSSLI